jgi:hypothetical protein
MVFQIKNSTLQIVIKQQMWGPLLIGAGVILLLIPCDTEARIIMGWRVWIAALLVVGGLVFMFIQAWPRRGGRIDEDANDMSLEGLGRLVRQLAQNYNLLRRQTTQGFIITLALMTLGVLVILLSVFGPMFGLTSDTQVVSAIAGIVTEMIGGTTLAVYKLNFQRLNEVSDRLEESWRILFANSVAATLPPEKRNEATVALIDALIRRTGRVTRAGGER